MRGENQLFLTDPARYLASKPLICFGATGGAAQTAAVNRINGNTLGVRQEFPPTVEFDLVLKPQGYVDLVMLGAVGTYGATRRFGRPVVGNYIPYLGQKDKKPSSAEFGRINLSRVTTRFVFTFSFTGCNFMVTREGGDAYVYHEPTSEAWSGTTATRYPGAQILLGPVGPAYDDTHVGGFGCLVRDDAQQNRWHLYAQSPDGMRMTQARLTTAQVDI